MMKINMMNVLQSSGNISKFGAVLRTFSCLVFWTFLVAHAAPVGAAERIVLGNKAVTALVSSDDPHFASTFPALQVKAAEAGVVRVIVGVRAAFAPEGELAESEKIKQRKDIAYAQDAVLSNMPSLASRYHTVKLFDIIPFIAMEVNGAELDALSRMPEVTLIEEDRLAKATLAQSVPLIGGVSGAFGGYTGSGQTVAILDTGVDKTHPALSGRVVSEACYSTNATYSDVQVNSICPGGAAESTVSGAALPYSSGVCPAGECDHGTHVAGIAASSEGVARGAQLIAVQVFSRIDDLTADKSVCGGVSTCVMSFTSDQLLGLERVNALRTTYNISSVNMSLGGGRYYNQSTCDAANPSLKAIIDTLRSNGIATVISSGNSGYIDSTGSPGCISSAVSVGATWDASGYTNDCDGNNLGLSSVDEIACYSNSASFLNLLAPGSLINSSIPSGGYANYQGTSMAAPHVAGAWAVLKQKTPTASVDQVLAALNATGVPIIDPRNGITKPRIKLDSAVSYLGNGTTYTLSVSKTGDGTITSSPAGINCGSACSYSFNSSSTVILTATPGAGFKLISWGGACSGSASTCSVTMSAAQTVTATFGVVQTVSLLSLSNLSGATDQQQFYSFNVPAGASNLVVKISGGTGDADLYLRAGSAPTTANYDCRPWLIGNEETCTIPSPQAITYYVMLRGYSAYSGVTLTVSYDTSAISYAVSITKTGSGTGMVTSTPQGISCGADCTESYPSGTSVVLTATPSAGSKFIGWSGSCSGSGVCIISVNSAINVIARFDKSNTKLATEILMLLLLDN